nr:MAG TPA: hypothetical protein [Caudoviricetes sp.]
MTKNSANKESAHHPAKESVSALVSPFKETNLLYHSLLEMATKRSAK